MPEVLSGPEPDQATVSFRSSQGAEADTTDWENAPAVIAGSLAPWRTFRWWYGQRHYSGTYWSATQRDHVVYESRLELARLLYADFCPDVNSIVAQPFLIEAEVEGKRRKHVPDYLFGTPAGPVVVDVKPLHRTTAPKVSYTLAWTRRLVSSLGWHYEVWSEPPPIELANLRFLAGYRNEERMNRKVVEHLEGAQLHGLSIRQVISATTAWSEPLVRAGVLHLLWRGVVETDLHVPLQSTAILREGVSK